MELSIFACRGSKILLCLLSLLVHLNISQTQRRNACKKKEVCSLADFCVGGEDLFKKGNYVSCTVRNNIPGMCCKNIKTTPVSQPKTTTDPNARFRSPKKVSMPTTLASTTRNPHHSPKNSTAVALQYCKKYGEYVDNYVRMKIHHGDDANSAEYPHMALIGFVHWYDGNILWNCGGSLISENFILSAAHCSANSQYGAPKWAKLGNQDITLNLDNPSSHVYSIAEVHNHRYYNKETHVHDIALFRLNTTVKLGPYVRPACLYTSTFHPVGTEASITGWGRKDANAARSNRLLKAYVKIIEDKECEQKLTNYNTATMICAADFENGNDQCEGDSGGPLQVSPINESGMWHIVGVISYSHGICGSKEIPSVYTKVTVYLDWIQPIVWP